MATMASATVHQVAVLGFSSKFAIPNIHHLFRSTEISPHSFWCSSLSKNFNHCLRVSSGGSPNELDEDSKFVPLNPDEASYGPPALLLLGFKLEEADQIQQLLKDLDGEFLKVIYCTEDMITRSLWDAVNTGLQAKGNLKIAESVPRICFLSGVSGEEMMMFIEAFQESSLEPAIFAALVPNSSNKPLQELIEEIMGDHEMVTKNQSGSMHT